MPPKEIDLIVFDSDNCDKQELYNIQHHHITNDTLNQLVFVAFEGSDDSLLDSSRFLVENRQCSWINHMMWNGLLSKEDQDKYTDEQARRFVETGVQMYIENYEFVEDEPFYDYSGR